MMMKTFPVNVLSHSIQSMHASKQATKQEAALLLVAHLHASEGLPSSRSTLQGQARPMCMCMVSWRLHLHLHFHMHCLDWQITTTTVQYRYYFLSLQGCRRQHNDIQHTLVHSMVCCQAAAGLHSTQGCSLHSSVSSSQLQVNSNHDCRGYLRCLPVVGVKAFMVHTNWLVSEK